MSRFQTMENMIEINVCLGVDDAQLNVIETLAWRISQDPTAKRIPVTT